MDGGWLCIPNSNGYPVVPVHERNRRYYHLLSDDLCYWAVGIMKVKVTYQRSDNEYSFRTVSSTEIEVNGSIYQLSELVAVFPVLPTLPAGVSWVEADDTFDYVVTVAVPYPAGPAPADYEVVTVNPEVIFDNRN